MQHLHGEYYLQQLSAEEFGPLFEKYRPLVFPNALSFRVREVFDEHERAALRAHSSVFSERFELRLGVYHKRKTFVGWHMGVHMPPADFYMMSSGVLPEHRGKGVYSALLEYVLARARAEGFQRVYSRHVATNNAILIAKLKAGFVVTGFELSDMHGLLVHLSYYFNPLRRKALDFRSGQSYPDAELRRYLDLGLDES